MIGGSSVNQEGNSRSMTAHRVVHIFRKIIMIMIMMMVLLVEMNSASQGAAASALAQTTISIKTSYNIAIRNGRLHQIPSSNYTSDLRHAMDSLAKSVASQLLRRTTASSGNNSNNSATTMPHVKTPTAITDLVAFTCPNNGNTSTNLNDTCQSVIVAIPLVLPSSTWNQTGIAAEYLHELRTAIDMGSLELFLVQVDPNTILRILPTTTTTTSNVPTLPTASPAVAVPSPSTSPFPRHFSSTSAPLSSSSAPSTSTYPPVYISRAPPTSPTTNNNRNTNNNNNNGNSNRAAAWGGAGGVVIFVLILVCLCCCVAVRKYPETFTVNQPL